MTKVPSSRIRTTISIEKDVHNVFVAMSEASGLSVSRCMGEWLADTVEGAQFVTQKLKEARNSPRMALAELHSAALGILDVTKDVQSLLDSDLVLKDFSLKGAKKSTKAPSSNTGLNYPKKS